MKNARKYRERAELAKDIVQSEAYRNDWRFGVDYTETIREIQRRNRKLVRENNDYIAVEGCDYRCVIRYYGDESGTWYNLESYDTDVCSIHYNADGCFFWKEWEGWTPTTMKHINAFRAQFGFKPMNKYDWLMLDLFEDERK